jgi:hypothetical protein
MTRRSLFTLVLAAFLPCATDKNSYGWFCTKHKGHDGMCVGRSGAMWLQIRRTFKYARTDHVEYSPF